MTWTDGICIKQMDAYTFIQDWESERVCVCVCSWWISWTFSRMDWKSQQIHKHGIIFVWNDEDESILRQPIYGCSKTICKVLYSRI